jgi:hypothetical protein
MSNNIHKMEASGDTPLFVFDLSAGSILIKGVSMPENAFEFFDPLEKEALSYFKDHKGELKMEVQIDYLNSMSGKQLFRLIRLLGDQHPSLQVRWRYKKGDELMRIKGEEIKALSAPVMVNVEELP